MKVLQLMLFVPTLLAATVAADKRVLVLLENLTVKETHSIYFRSLVEEGFDLTYKVGPIWLYRLNIYASRWLTTRR